MTGKSNTSERKNNREAHHRGEPRLKSETT